MIIASFLTYKSVLQRPTVNNSLSFSGINPRAASKCVLPEELQGRLHQFAKQYNFACQKPLQFRLKRAMDIIGAGIGLVLTSPIMAASAAAIKLESKGPILFTQKRVGQMGEEFDMYKFRSMQDAPDTEVIVANKKDPRITKVGRILRRFSIDELPQLWNIFKGDMSLVGPRPRPLKADMELLNLDQNSVRRFVFKPGAGLNYRAVRDEDYADRIATEKAYLSNWSLAEDFKHFLGICKKMLMGKNY